MPRVSADKQIWTTCEGAELMDIPDFGELVAVAERDGFGTIDLTAGDESMTATRQAVQQAPLSVVLSIMQDAALRALGEPARSPEIGSLSTTQARDLHDVFEISATGMLLADDFTVRLDVATEVFAYCAGWDDVRGLEGLYTSALNVLGSEVPLEYAAGASRFWEEQVRDGAYGQQHGAIVLSQSAEQLSFLGPGALAQLELSADMRETLGRLDLGPSGYGPSLSTLGFGGQQGGVDGLTAGYPSDYFAEDEFVPGVMSANGFKPFSQLGGKTEGSFAPGMLGSQGFVPGGFDVAGPQPTFSPVQLGSGYFPNFPDMVGGGCPIDDSAAADVTTGRAVHHLAHKANQLGTVVIGAGLGAATAAGTFGAVEASFAVLVPWSAPVTAPMAVEAFTVAAGGLAIAAAGAELKVVAGVVEAVTKPDPPSTSSAPAPPPPPTPSPKDEEEFDSYCSTSLGLPSGFHGLFPGGGCPDPFRMSLSPFDELGVDDAIAFVPDVAVPDARAVDPAETRRVVVHVRKAPTDQLLDRVTAVRVRLSDPFRGLDGLPTSELVWDSISATYVPAA
jgi:hypothetical protein